ncbi:MAG: ATP-binding protein [Bacteroidia bacterium]
MRNINPPFDMIKHLEMLDALFKHATEGIIVTNTKGEIVMVNPKALEQFGYSEEKDLLGQKIEVLIPKRYERGHVKHRENFSKNPHSRPMGANIELYARRKDDSEFPVEVSLSHFTTDDDQYIMSFIVDITERVKQQESIKNLNIELERRVKERTEELAEAINRLAESKQEVMQALERERELNELKSRFVTTASHEFRTPLGTILSSVSLISKYQNTEDQPKREKHIERIKSAVSNLTEILNDFLSLEKLEEGIIRNNPQPMHLEKFMKDIIDEMRAILKSGQTIKYQHIGEYEIILDCQLLKNVMLNLISNAIKYSPEDKEIHVKSEYANGSLKIDVVDQGIGIPEEDKPHMFQRFFRANNAGNIQGTGLGLNIVKKYIELMDGEISFDSELGKGTTFTVIIPIKK